MHINNDVDEARLCERAAAGWKRVNEGPSLVKDSQS